MNFDEIALNRWEDDGGAVTGEIEAQSLVTGTITPIYAKEADVQPLWHRREKVS
jgi:hypothetical protein